MYLNIRKQLLFAMALTAIAIYPQERRTTGEKENAAVLLFCNVIGPVITSGAKAFAYYALAKRINKSAVKTHTVPIIGSVSFDRTECIVESAGIILRALTLYLIEKEIIEKNSFSNCKKKDLCIIPLVLFRIVLEQGIMAKRFDEMIAEQLIDEKLHPKRYKMVQNFVKWAIAAGVVVGSSWVNHKLCPTSAKSEFLFLVPGLPCTTFFQKT